MGAYLSKPVTEKTSLDCSSDSLTYGLSEMQGWRRSMEDAHIAQHALPDGLSMFAVFDGHGGTEVSKFCAKYMPQMIRQMPAYSRGEHGVALTQVFHKMDDMLRDEKFYSEVQSMRNTEEDGGGGGSGSGDVGEAKEEGDGGPDAARMDLLQKLLTLKRLVDTGGMQGSDAEGGGGGGSGNGGGGGGGGVGGGGGGGAPMCRLADHQIQAGCTAVVCVLTPHDIIVANAGDSRAVLCRAGTAMALSADHKPNQERERNRIVSAGGFVTDMHGQHRVNGNLNLSRAIGDLKYKGIKELAPKDQIITAEPDIMVQPRDPQDEFLVLACDGVWDCMSNQECVDFVRERLATCTKTSEVTEQLLDHCLAGDPREAHGIGCDNMTAIVVQFKGKP